jgi:hypothetical protein
MRSNEGLSPTSGGAGSFAAEAPICGVGPVEAGDGISIPQEPQLQTLGRERHALSAASAGA